jgi:ribosomal protein S18 acetylase RimI-like enzyme
MASNSPTIRLARSDDLPLLTRTLGRAVAEDPLAAWSCPYAALRPAMLESIHSARLRQYLAYQQVWTTPECSSVALWGPPRQRLTSLRHNAYLARRMLHPLLLTRLPMLAVGLATIQRRHPHQPDHWYLSLLGTDPEAQGRGLGSAVLQPVLERCDADGVGAYLESSDERNLHFYARHGFRVTEEFNVPRGPRIWTLWRDPRGGSQ